MVKKMITQNIKQTLHQFKRIHKSQIAPKGALLNPELDAKMKRRHLKQATPQELKRIVKALLSSIDDYQKHRDRPHQGLNAFKQTLSSLLS